MLIFLTNRLSCYPLVKYTYSLSQKFKSVFLRLKFKKIHSVSTFMVGWISRFINTVLINVSVSPSTIRIRRNSKHIDMLFTRWQDFQGSNTGRPADRRCKFPKKRDFASSVSVISLKQKYEYHRTNAHFVFVCKVVYTI